MAHPHDDAVDHSWVQAVVSRARADLEASAVLHESSPAAVAMADRTRVRGPHTSDLASASFEWSVRGAVSPSNAASKGLAARPRTGYGLHAGDGRLRSDLEWRGKTQMQVEVDLLAVMSEWREKVAALEDRLENMGRRHQLEVEELNKQMRGMYSQDFVGALQRNLANAQCDLASALNLRESALSDDLDARDVVIKELGHHLKTAHENNQRMHSELQELQTKHHAEIAGFKARETRLKGQAEDLQEALRAAHQKTAEAQSTQQSQRNSIQELADLRVELLDCCAEKERLKRESEWAVSKMTVELQRAQQSLASFESEMQELKTRGGTSQEPVQQAATDTVAHLHRELDVEKQRSASLVQQTEALRLELKRKVEEIGQLHQISDTSSQSLSADDTHPASSPTKRSHSWQPQSPIRPGLQEQQGHARLVSQIAALRSSIDTKDRECIELRSALVAHSSNERVMIESLQSKDSKIVQLENAAQQMRTQLDLVRERELSAHKKLRETSLQVEEDRTRLLNAIKDIEREREAAVSSYQEAMRVVEARSKLVDTKDEEIRRLQEEFDRAASEWKACKLDFNTRIAEVNARAATSQEAIMLLEADLEMKNNLLDQVVESRGGGNETLNIYVASLHHAGLIAKSLDNRNKELRKKMGEAEQYRLTGHQPPCSQSAMLHNTHLTDARREVTFLYILP
jgi:chromosome segregation ATPase